GEPARELFGRLLGLELRELRVLLGEHRAGLQLEQRRDEDQELATRVEIELALAGEVLDEADDDRGEVDLAKRQLLAQDERQQQVERPFERVEVQLELADGHRHPRNRTRTTGRGRAGSPSPAPSSSPLASSGAGAARGAAAASSGGRGAGGGR